MPSLSEIEWTVGGAVAGGALGYALKGKAGAVAGSVLGAILGYGVNVLLSLKPQGTGITPTKYTGALFPALDVGPLAQGKTNIIDAVLQRQPNATAYTPIQYPGSATLPTVVGPINFTWGAGTNLSSVLHGAEIQSGYGGR